MEPCAQKENIWGGASHQKSERMNRKKGRNNRREYAHPKREDNKRKPEGLQNIGG